MAGEFGLLHEQQMTRMGNIAAQAHENFTTWQDLAKLDHMEHKRTISLVQAAGMRELQAKVTPGGPYPSGQPTQP
jgi:hypothetical protein